jgi:hypothetical protein
MEQNAKELIAKLEIPYEKFKELNRILSTTEDAINITDGDHLIHQAIVLFEDGFTDHVNVVMNNNGETRVDSFLHKGNHKVDYDVKFVTYGSGWNMIYRGDKYTINNFVILTLPSISLSLPTTVTWADVLEEVRKKQNKEIWADDEAVYATSLETADQLADFVDEMMGRRDGIAAMLSEPDADDKMVPEGVSEYWRIDIF